MKPRAYIETSVIGYLTAWPTSDVIVSGHQEVTRHWWKTAPDTLTLIVSELVIQEVSAGDEIAAQERLEAINPLGVLETTEEAVALAEQLVQTATLPKKAAEDALHIAICATHGVEYLVTWNCRHIANATIRSQIETVCRAAGYEPPIICTPDELAGTDGGDLD